MRSPFVYGKLAQGRSFTGRQNEVLRLLANFHNKINTIIISPRRWGKSSLLHHVSSQVNISEGGYVFCFLDLYKVRSDTEFYHYLANEIIKATSASLDERFELSKAFMTRVNSQLALAITPENEFDVRFEFSSRMDESVLNLGNEIARKKGITLIICIDNFQSIENFENSAGFQKKLNAYWRLQDQTVYCLYGSKRPYLNRIFTAAKQPFCNFGDILQLDKLPFDKLTSFIALKFEESNKVIPLDLCEKIVLLMDSHPFYVQQLAHIIWQNTSSRVNDDILQSSLNELMERNLLLFQKEYDNLSSLQINFLKALLDGVKDSYTSKIIIQKYKLNSSATVLRVIEGLEKKEIIERNAGKLEFIDPAFRNWLKEYWSS